MSKSQIDLTKGNLFRNLIKLSLPIMLSNFMQMFYNLTDAFWLGKLGGEVARNAVSVAGMAFPLIFFISSFGFGFVVAGTSLISQYKGAGSIEKMKEVVGQFCVLLIMFSLIFISAGFIFIDQILVLLKTPTEIFSSAQDYISVIMMGMFFMFIFMSYQSFSHGLGDTVSPMKIQLISVGLNVVLDPLMIFGIMFFPRMEIMGAAIATLVARIIGAVLSIYYLYKKSPQIVPEIKDFTPDFLLLKKIFQIGVPASMAQSMTSFGFLILQGFVNSYGTIVMSVFAIGNRMTGLFMMPAMGISNALSAIIGQNLGARNVERAEKSVGVAFRLVMIIMASGSLLLFFFGAQFTQFFINDPEIIAVGGRMFKVTSIAATIFGVMFVYMGVFNGSGHTKPAMMFNITRLWILRIPLVYILSGKVLNYTFISNSFLAGFLYKLSIPLSEYSYDSLWWSMLASNIITAIISYIVYKKGSWKKAKIFS